MERMIPISFPVVCGIFLIDISYIIKCDVFQQQKACVIANEGILDAFLDVNRSERRRFRIRFSGKTHINAHAMCSFIKVGLIFFNTHWWFI